MIELLKCRLQSFLSEVVLVTANIGTELTVCTVDGLIEINDSLIIGVSTIILSIERVRHYVFIPVNTHVVTDAKSD
jgi:hypothetical protein